jgi:predicted DNA binding CopG/RHH family protein
MKRIVKRRKKVPEFRNENAEFDFWSTKDSTDFFTGTEELNEKIEVTKRKLPKKRITMLLDPRLKLKLEKIAAEKGVAYQTLIQIWLREKVNQEIKRKVAS